MFQSENPFYQNESKLRIEIHFLEKSCRSNRKLAVFIVNRELISLRLTSLVLEHFLR